MVIYHYLTGFDFIHPFGGGLKYFFLFSPLPGEDSHFD